MCTPPNLAGNNQPNSCQAPFDVTRSCPEPMQDLDMSCRVITAPILNAQDLQPSMTAANSMTRLRKVDLSGQRFDSGAFECIIEMIKSHPGVKELHVSKSLLTEDQRKQLIELTGINELKGLKFITSEGEQLGSVHTNWDIYAEEKRNSYLNGMRETTRQALDFIVSEYGRPPAFTLDFGAGTGIDTINLAIENCPQIWAVDGDDTSLIFLQDSVRELEKSGGPLKSEITCINAPFITLEVPEPVELLVSSYTWPYRRPSDFPDCWKKCVDIVKIGGYISGQFFGPLTGEAPDPGMTYHTEEELRQLLSEHFELVWFRKEPEGGDFKIFGGEKPAWGDLYHIVAKRITSSL